MRGAIAVTARRLTTGRAFRRFRDSRSWFTYRKECLMALGDKIPDAAENLVGKAEEAAGKAISNQHLISKGQGDQVKAHILQSDDPEGTVE